MVCDGIIRLGLVVVCCKTFSGSCASYSCIDGSPMAFGQNGWIPPLVVTYPPPLPRPMTRQLAAFFFFARSVSRSACHGPLRRDIGEAQRR